MKMPTAISGINPENLKDWTRFKVRDNGTGDCITQEERASKNGKFKQNTLSLLDLQKEECELRFLTAKDTNALSKNWGEESESWIGHWLEVRDKPSNKLNAKTGEVDTFHNAEIRTSGADCDIEDFNTGKWL